jgi:hypothetical protein
VSARQLPVLAACALAFLISLRYFALESHSLGISSSVKFALAGVQAGALLAFAFLSIRVPASSRIWRLSALAALVFAAATLPWLHGYFDRPELRETNQGGDRDDAMIDAVARLVSGIDPYVAPVYTGAPISPGPGWLLLNPFAFEPAGFALMLPVHALLFACLAARATGGWKAPAVAILGCLGSTAVWENAFGGDLASLGFALASAGILCANARTSPVLLWLCAIFVGFLATARPPLLALPIFAALIFFWARGERRRAVTVGLAGTIVALALHGAFAFGFDRAAAYPPAHLFSAGARLFGVPGLVILIVFLAGTVGLLGRRISLASDPAAIYAMGLLLAFAPISLATIAASGYRLDGPIDWTGYTVVALPSFFYFAARRLDISGTT